MKDLKIKHKLFIFISLGAILTSLLGWLFVQQSQTLYEQLIYSENANRFYAYSQRMEEKFKEIDKLSLSVMADSDVQRYLKVIKTAPDTYEAFDAANRLKQKLLTYHLYEYSVSSIVIVDTNSNLHSVGANIERMNYYDMDDIRLMANKREGASMWIGGRLQDDAFFSVREIKEMAELNLQSLGTLFIRVQADKIVYSSPNESGGNEFPLLILSGEDIIYPAQSKVRMKDLQINESKAYSIITLNKDTYLEAHFTLGYTGWTFVHLIPYSSIFRHVTIMKGVLLALYAIILLALLWFGLRFSRSITRPIESLTQKMVNVEKGQFDIDKTEPTGNRDEIGLLNRNFDKMTDRLNTLINENYIKQIMLKEAEYETLKAKVNPHFLYNTLESINWLARLNGQKEISGMVKALGDMMRNAVSKKEFVTIQEELSNLQNYIYIQKFRFEDRLICHIEIPEHLHPLFMPSLIVQQVVENCVKYGVERETGKCEITVQMEERPDRLLLFVKDTGPGMDTAYMKKVEQNELLAEGTGIGLPSIDRRLKLLFGDEYGIDIVGEPDQGAVICISLPYISKIPLEFKEMNVR